MQTVTTCRVLALGHDDFMRLRELYPECTAEIVSNLHAQAKATAAITAATSAFLDAPLPPAGRSPPARSRSRSHSPRSDRGDPGSGLGGAFGGPLPSSTASARTGFHATSLIDRPGSPALSAASKRGSPRSCDVVAAAAAVAHESHAGAAYRLDVDGRPSSARTVASDTSTPRQDTLGIFMRTRSSNSGGMSPQTSAEITAHVHNGAVPAAPPKQRASPLSGMAVNSMDIYAAQWMPSPRGIGGADDTTAKETPRPRSGPRSWFRGRSGKSSMERGSVDGEVVAVIQAAAVAEAAQPGPVAEAAEAAPVAEAARAGSSAALLAAQLESADDIFLSSYTPIVGAMDAAALVAEDETRDALRKAIKHVVRAIASFLSA